MSATASGGHDRSGIEAQRRGRRLPVRLLRLTSDERLVELLRGGSEAAFEVMYARHHRGILSFCRHMLSSVEEAEDAVQHTFLAAYRDLVGSEKPIRLRPWLYTIARNRCLGVLRARRERTSEALVEPSTEHLADAVERRQDLRALLGDLAALPADQRAALVLAELGDLSHDDIGQVLGCRQEKVKALVFQARSSLIASRTAREISCEEIREQLANLRGGALRRSTLWRHLRECEGCRDFRAQVRRQREALALILPVAPSLGLKATVLGAAGVTAASGGSATTVVATTAVVIAVAGGGTVAQVSRDEPEPPRARVAAPVARTHEVSTEGRGKGADAPEAARPVRAHGSPAAPPDHARGPEAKAEKARGPKKAKKPKKAEKVRGPKTKAEKVRGPKPKAEKVRGPKPKVATVRVPKAEKVTPPKPKRMPKPKAVKVKPKTAVDETGSPPKPAKPDKAAEPLGKSKKG